MAVNNPFAVPGRLTRLQIEITTGCNLRCAGCQRTLGMREGNWHNGHMPETRFRAILDNAPPADAVILQGIGEPTLHPHLLRFVAIARECGKFPIVSFNTNALVRDVAYYQALRDAGLNHVSVSVDSLDPATAEATRAGTDCARLEAAISELLALFGPGVTFSIVLSRANADALPNLLRQLHRLGARVIEIQPLVHYGPTTGELSLAQSELIRVRQSIPATLPGGMNVLFAAAMTPNGTRCRRPFHAAYATLDGYLTPCCVTNDAEQFGRASLAETPFALLWQHPGVAAWMQRYLDREPAICRGCAFNPSVSTKNASIDAAEGLLRAGRLDQCEAEFRAALDASCDAAALHGLGLIRIQRGDLSGALPWLRLAHELAPEPRRSHNLAACMNGLGETERAIAIERAVVASDVGYVPARLALADMLAAKGTVQEAGETLMALGEQAVAADRIELAAAVVDRLLGLPRSASPLRLANLFRCAGWQDLSKRLSQALLRTDGQDAGVRLVLAMSHLAMVHVSEADIAARRRAYAGELDRLDAVTASAPASVLARAVSQLGNAKPFFLAYQGDNDLALQETYGRIITRIAKAAYGPLDPPAPPRDGPVRIGLASAYFHLHSVSKLFGGWIRHLDPARFRIFGYQLSSARDATADTLAAACASFVRGDYDACAWRQRILDDRLHVLIYPEIGMHPLPVQLACSRLAPVQCVAWGHPVTTGLPSIDYFLSSELMEPEDGDAHYLERLIRLPNLSIYYEPLPDLGRTMPRERLGVESDAVVYLCCQSIFKYHPRYDAVFPRIAAQVPAARFVFIGTYREPTKAFEARLAQCFAGFGLDAARHVRIVPRVSHEEFPALLRASDVYLDSIGWSGGNTTLEALACDLPVVTTPTNLMRGRHSTAILRHIGLADRVADSVDRYVELATELAEADIRAQYHEATRQAKSRMYYDLTPVRALEEFLLRAVCLCDAHTTFGFALSLRSPR